MTWYVAIYHLEITYFEAFSLEAEHSVCARELAWYLLSQFFMQQEMLKNAKGISPLGARMFFTAKHN